MIRISHVVIFLENIFNLNGTVYMVISLKEKIVKRLFRKKIN